MTWPTASLRSLTVPLMALSIGLVASPSAGQYTAEAPFRPATVPSGRAAGMPALHRSTVAARPWAGSEEKRDVFGDFGGGVVSLGRDAVDFVTAPFHMSRRQALELGAVLAVGGLILAFDQEIHDWVLRTQDDGPWKAVLDVGQFFEPVGLMNNTNPYWLAGIGVTYALRQEALMRVFQQLLFSHLISGATMGVTRPLIARERPRDADDPYTFRFREGTSFPSGHTSTIFELARVLSHHLGWWPASVALYGVAGSVAYERMAGEFDEVTGDPSRDAPHWPSDVWFGAWWGIAVANVVIGNDEEDSNFRLTTAVDRGTGALRVGAYWRF